MKVCVFWENANVSFEAEFVHNFFVLSNLLPIPRSIGHHITGHHAAFFFSRSAGCLLSNHLHKSCPKITWVRNLLLKFFMSHVYRWIIRHLSPCSIGHHTPRSYVAQMLLLLTPNEILKKTENRVLLSVSECRCPLTLFFGTAQTLEGPFSLVSTPNVSLALFWSIFLRFTRLTYFLHRSTFKISILKNHVRKCLIGTGILRLAAPAHRRG